MDGTRFDNLARRFAVPVSRRWSLLSLVAGLTGAAVLPLGSSEDLIAEAHDALKKCKGKKGKKKKNCIKRAKRHNKTHECQPDDCGVCGACIGGKCVEVPGLCDEESCERCNTTTWTCEPKCSGMFGDCCGGECRLSSEGPWAECGEFCCPAEQECKEECDFGFCCYPDEVCVPDCLGPGIPACCPKVIPNCCDN